MDQPQRVDRSLIEPVYLQNEANQAIEFGLVRVEWTDGGATHQADAVATLQFEPDERLCFVITTDEAIPLAAARAFREPDWGDKLRLVDRGVSVDVFCTSLRTGSQPPSTAVFMPRRSVVTCMNPTDRITEARFHLFNAPEFFGTDDFWLDTGQGTGLSGIRCGRVRLRAGDFDVIIGAGEKTNELCKSLAEKGGFVITHTGSVRRRDGASFSSEQLENLLECLHYFFSFTFGRWAGVALPVGFDESGNRIWEQWGVPRISRDAWHGSNSWFDQQHAELLAEVFPGFFERWSQDLWRDALRFTVSWYVAANERGTGIGVDAALVFAQTAIERLAWTYCVLDRKMLSREAFGRKGLSAADRLRLLGSALGVPAPIPSKLTALHGKPGQKWSDLPEAITRIRNSLVHPREGDSLLEGSYYEAWLGSLWYLDLALLCVCGHQGGYSNRMTKTHVGQVEAVPWASKPSEKRL